MEERVNCTFSPSPTNTPITHNYVCFVTNYEHEGMKGNGKDNKHVEIKLDWSVLRAVR